MAIMISENGQRNIENKKTNANEYFQQSSLDTDLYFKYL